MPKVRWGIDAADIDDYDRSKQFAPYTGKIPPLNTVYQWKLKTAKYVSGGREKNDQLRLGLELIPRDKSEQKYAGYFLVKFCNISPKAAFTYVPFLDTIGVSATDFTERTISDEEGNIQRIGKWRNNGELLLLGRLQEREGNDGKMYTEVGWVGPLAQGDDELDDDEDYDDDEIDDEDDDYEDEPAPPPRRKPAQAAKRVAPKQRRARPVDDEEDPF